jgi:hypothetical protein
MFFFTAPVYAGLYLALIACRPLIVPRLDHERDAPVVAPELTKQERLEQESRRTIQAQAEESERQIIAKEKRALVLTLSNSAASTQSHQQAMELARVKAPNAEDQAETGARPSKRAKTSRTSQPTTDPATAKSLKDLEKRFAAAQQSNKKTQDNNRKTQDNNKKTQDSLRAALSKTAEELRAARSLSKANDVANNRKFAKAEKLLGKRKAGAL